MKIEKILLVDDDQNIQLIAQMGLEDRPDWQVVLASSGAEALEKFAKEKPDLVLLDIMMPGMDGITTLAKLKEQSNGKKLQVIFMTAKVQQHELESYLALGIAGVIAKPFDPMTLSCEISKLWELNRLVARGRFVKSLIRVVSISGALLVLAAVIVAGYFSYKNQVQLSASRNWVVHIHQVIIQLKDVLAALEDCETGERGYIITGDVNYLVPYERGLKKSDLLIAKLERLVVSDSYQQKYIDDLKPQIVSELAELQKIVDLRRNEGFAASSKAVNSGVSKAIMDKIRWQLAAMEKREQDLLVEKFQMLDRDFQIASSFTIAAVTLFFILLLFILIVIVRLVSELERKQSRLQLQYKIASVLTKPQPLRRALVDILQVNCEQLGWDIAAFWQLNKEQSLLKCIEIWQSPTINLTEFQNISRSLTYTKGIGLPGQVWQFDEPQWVADMSTIVNFQRSEVAAKENLHGALAIPIRGTDNFIGVLEFFSRRIQRPDKEMLASLLTVSSHIGQFIENKQAAEESAKKDQVVALAADIGEVLTKIDSLRNMLRGCTTSLVKHLPIEFARIWTVHEDENTLELQGLTGSCPQMDSALLRIPFGVGSIGQVAQTRQPLWSNQIQDDNYLSENQWVTAGQARGLAACPLLVEGTLVGVMAVMSHRVLGQEVLTALSAIADTVALGIERKNKERALRHHAETLKESERFHNLAIQGSQEGIWDWNLITNEHYYSAKCKEQLGYQEEETDLVKQDLVRQLAHPDDIKKVERALEAHLKQRVPYDIQYRLQAKDGSYRWIHSRGQAVWDDSGKPIRMAGFHWDITERVNREELLKDSERRFRAIFDQTFQFIGILSPEGILLEANRGSLEFEGVAASDFLGQPFWKMPWWQQSKDGQEKLKKAIREASQGDFVRFEAEHIGPDGIITVDFSLKPVLDETGKVVMIIPEGRDITERIRAERALADREARTRAILDTAAEGIITITDQGVIESANNAAHVMFRYGRGELIGQDVISILPDFFSRGRLAKVRSFKRASTGEHKLVGSGFETAGRRADGSKLPVEIALSVGDAGGQPIITGILRDITERKEVERRLREFYSMVSHELRTPLTSIRGSLSLMEGGRTGELPPRAVHLVKIAHVETERLIRLINDILDIRKIEAGKLELKLEEVEISDMVEASLNGIRAMADQANVTLTAQIETTDKLACDGDRINQVLTNLLSNAIKFSPAGANVIVRVEKVENDLFRFSVVDKGPGIPEGQRHKLFGLFQQLDLSDSRPKGGTGLGLAISKGIVEEHHGRMGLDSIVGEGATFWFEIPSVVRSAPVMLTTNQTLSAIYTILVVDNDESSWKVVKPILESQGLKVFRASSVKEAEKWLDTYGSPNVIICDVQLPDGQGRSMVEKLTKQGGAGDLIPVIILSKRSAVAEGHNYPHFVDWLEKPVEEKRLISAVRIAVRRRTPGAARVLVVEADQATREIIRHDLSTIGVECIEAADGMTGIRLARQHDPDLIVMAPDVPSVEGFELVRVLGKERSQTTPLIVYTDRDLTSEDKQNLTLGVTAHLTKSRTSEEDLFETIKSMLNGLVKKATVE